MKPIISTSGKTTQLQYELSHRIHDTKVYPVKAPNGSTIILYGHETGVGILWRGGRPLKQVASPKQAPKPPPKVNGTSNNDVVMIIDSDDDEPAQAAPQLLPQAEFEEEEEELDPDSPYPSFIQQLRLSLNTEVLHIAVPQVPTVSALRPADTIPPIFCKRLVFAVACADYSVRIITLPLSPPSHAAKEAPLSAKSQYGEDVFKIPTYVGHQSIPKGLSLTWTARGEPVFKDDSEDDMDIDNEDDAPTPGRRRPRRRQSRADPVLNGASEEWDLLIASHSTERGGLLKLWRFGLSETSIAAANPISAYQTLNLKKPASRVMFNSALFPKRRHSQLLITDSSGTARIYDPLAPSNRKRRVASATSDLGAFVGLYRASFEDTKANVPTPPVLAARKSIIDAAWASDGQSIVALLSDGEWGVWDVARTSPSPPADPSAFSLRGFVGVSDTDRASSVSSSPKSRSGRGSLAPMTPNTRRRKEETLFHGSSSSSSGPTRGGVSVASLASTTGGIPEDSVLFCYGSELYRIPDLAKLWSRTANGTKSGLATTQLHGLPLFGEFITCVQQFDTTSREARMAIPRDILVAAEHRLIISTATTEPLGRDLNATFSKEKEEEELSRKTDQVLLSRGELDLGGMDRLLDSFEGNGSAPRGLSLGNPRKVLFASSTS
ncbi:hypothetical protein BS50DRAFT_121377 [Corynespora cassiicola Philippines]|uniref:WD40 repeat-like protein n=1 Tax=Corynespora cassiicola Philippines TaxID=1448308 RepID=A0A2T2NAS7_CORCC|nr:hypothetical protein BS50DRAFT_121377 [Corynespora cassiicola Philippines]